MATSATGAVAFAFGNAASSTIASTAITGGAATPISIWATVGAAGFVILTTAKAFQECGVAERIRRYSRGLPGGGPVRARRFWTPASRFWNI